MKLLLDSYRAAIDFVGHTRRWRWVVLLLLALTLAGLEAMGAALIYTLVALVSQPGTTFQVPILGDIGTYFPDMSPEALQVATAITVAVFFLLRGVFLVGQEYVRSRIVQNAGAQVAQRLVAGYLELPYLIHTQRNSSELVRNSFETAQRFVNIVVMPLITVLSELVLVVALVAVLAVVSPIATLIAMIVFLPTILLLQRYIQPRLKRLGRRSQDARKGSLGALQQALGGIREIRLLGRERFFGARFAAARAELARSEYLKTTLAAVPRTLIETVLVFTIVSIFLVAVVQGDGFQSAFAALGVFAYTGLRLQPALQKIVAALNQLKFGNAILDDLRSDLTIIDAAPRLDGGGGARVEPSEPFGTLEFRNVTFSYSPTATPAVRDINVLIEAGEFIGVCGPTGGGKSTFVDLLIGLLTPDNGEVLIDGRPLVGSERDWYPRLGVVSQNVYLIDDTLRANIAFGLHRNQADDHAIEWAVDRAQLRDVIDQLPDGLETYVGERGIRLSGGQRQRVAVARALYLEPEVVVFDEGTSALDTGTERALIRAVDELRSGRTLISVAHRISTVRDADRILVFDHGRIVDQGTYDELASVSPLFQRLAQ